MTYFANIHTLNDLKTAFHALALKFHPDCGGSDEAMKALNAEYTAKFEELKRCQNEAAKADTSGSTKATTEAPEEFINIISALLRLDGLTVELCGCWLWISGNTKEHKEALKAAGCRWAANKKMLDMSLVSTPL